MTIPSPVPIEDVGARTFCGHDGAGHATARLASGMVIHDVHVPAGGDVADSIAKVKLRHKLEFSAELRAWFTAERPHLAGDLNVAPREDDVWNHEALRKGVLDTPVEVEGLAAARGAGGRVDVTRAHVPEGRLCSWRSHRSPDLEAVDKGRQLHHVRATPDLARVAGGSRIGRRVRGWRRPSDHAPVLAEFEA